MQKDVAEKSGWEVVWLKHLATELESEGRYFLSIPAMLLTTTLEN